MKDVVPEHLYNDATVLGYFSYSIQSDVIFVPMCCDVGNILKDSTSFRTHFSLSGHLISLFFLKCAPLFGCFPAGLFLSNGSFPGPGGGREAI